MPHIKPSPRNGEVDFRGEKRSNATHASMTDPDARLYKKAPGTGAALCFVGHGLMENHSGLIVQADLTRATGRAERQAAIDMIHRHSPGSTRRLTLGADKGYDAAEFVTDLRQACVTPHVAQKSRYSAIDGRTTRPRATPCPSGTANGSKKHSAGQKQSEAQPKPPFGASNGHVPASS